MGRNRTPQYLDNIQIIDAGAKGKSIAKTNDGQVILVSYGVPGDTVELLLTKKRRHFREGIITKVYNPSKDRILPKCEHFGTCGGCKWQQMDYQKQLFYKQKEVATNLKRIGKVEPPSRPIIGSEAPFHYRNKMEFSFSNNRWLSKQELMSKVQITQRNALGFHVSGMWDKVLDIENCHLHTSLSNDILKAVKTFTLEHKMSFFDYKNKCGLLRNLMIRTNTKDQAMVLIQFHDDDKEKREKLLTHLQDRFPNIHSLLYAINRKNNDSIYDLDIEVFAGKDFILEYLNGYKFKINAKSFFQTNTKQAGVLYKTIADFASLSGEETLYDLYSGTGSIAISLAKQGKKIIGIETVKEAVTNARENADINNIDNVSFLLGDVKNMLSQSLVETSPPDIIITDPPREGIHKDVVKRCLEILPKKIVYVSCNAATQARDIQLLLGAYSLEKSQAVDMFPHTHHIENIALLSKK
ncbi:23S rRNA (Uracil-5-)-methyltransferase RumA [Elysia marginata]|uniref:tRNA (uracil(54)-C(5))-methyltransferase n=1 Tax=Elysia marginata TaxID=1093978 RepID=A0AAV4FW01_9GAST|nr:23S rRNA (Uracil-5-)-methyltransferase RumA [Elysia marginata]